MSKETQDTQIQLIVKEVSPLTKRVESLVVNDERSHQAAVDLGNALNRGIKRIREFFSPMKVAAKAAHQAVVDREKEVVAGPEYALEVVRSKVNGYLTEQNRRAEEARRAAAAAAVKPAPPPPPPAAAASRSPKPAPPPPLPPVAAAAPPPKAEGSSQKKDWEIEVLDLKLLCAAVGAGKVPIKAVSANLLELKRIVGVYDGAVDLPGVKITEKISVSFRG